MLAGSFWLSSDNIDVLAPLGARPVFLFSGYVFCLFLRDGSMQRILIVDDSNTIRKMVRASLQSLDEIEFLDAASGLEAIEHLAIARVGLIVLDLNMPDMHGIDVLKFVRSHRSYQDVPVIVLTTRGDEESRLAAVQAGATTYLTKPFAPQMLATTARALLGGPTGPVAQR
jgi:two-component system chemotaxis response regulator CheY